jgi:hypothetical protein
MSKIFATDMTPETKPSSPERVGDHVPHLNKNIASGYPPDQGSNRGGFSRASTTILSETHTIKIMHGYPILNQEPYLSISVVSSRPFSTWDIQASGRVHGSARTPNLFYISQSNYQKQT